MGFPVSASTTCPILGRTDSVGSGREIQSHIQPVARSTPKPAGLSLCANIHRLTFADRHPPVAEARLLGAPSWLLPREVLPEVTRWFVSYSERRKLRTSCFWFSRSWLKFPITAFASEALRVKTLPLLCARIASSKSDVRPSCRKKSRCPSPHSGAVRNSLGPACP